MCYSYSKRQQADVLWNGAVMAIYRWPPSAYIDDVEFVQKTSVCSQLVYILGYLSAPPVLHFSSLKLHNTTLCHSHNKCHLLSLRPSLLIRLFCGYLDYWEAFYNPDNSVRGFYEAKVLFS